LPTSLPAPQLPELGWTRLVELLPAAFTIAFLAGIESLLSAVVADGMSGGKHRSNTELVAQGVANTASALFGGLPATGAIARTATNIRAGARTPAAGMLHPLCLLLFVLVGAKLAAWVPLPALAGVLVVVAWNMSEHGHFRHVLRSAPRGDRAVLLLTFLLTVFVDLTLAIQVGMVVAAFVFMYRMSEAVQAGAGLNLGDGDEDAATEAARRTREEDARQRIGLPRGVEVFRIAGPLFFGAANRLDNLLDRLVPKPRVFILRMRMVPIIDASGVHALSNLAERCRRQGIVLVLSGLQEQPRKVLAKMGMRQNEGALYLVRDFDEARTVAERLVGTQAGGGWAGDGLSPARRPGLSSGGAGRGWPRTSTGSNTCAAAIPP